MNQLRDSVVEYALLVCEDLIQPGERRAPAEYGTGRRLRRRLATFGALRGSIVAGKRIRLRRDYNAEEECR